MWKVLRGVMALGTMALLLATGATFTPRVAHAAPGLTPIDLGTLPGYASSGATDVSGAIVVGSAQDASGNFRAFAYDLGATSPHMVDLGTLGGIQSDAAAVSGAIVVGSAQDASGAGHAFAYDLGAASPHMVDLDTLGSNSSYATDVSGSIVVGSVQVAGATHAFAYDLGATSPHMVDLGTLPGYVSSSATAVSGSIVVGYADPASGPGHAFAYNLNTATMKDLGMLPDGSGSRATDVSGNIVVGYAYTADGHPQAFAYDLGATSPTMQDLGTLGGIQSVANAISGNIVVGDSFTADGGQHAFAYDLNTAAMKDLGTLPGYPYTFATKVSGPIVAGVGFPDPSGDSPTHAFAYDLAATSPTMVDLGTLGGSESRPFAVSGNVVVGSALTTGNAALHATVWLFGADATPPTITISSPAATPAYAQDQSTPLTIAFRVADNFGGSGVDSVQATLDNGTAVTNGQQIALATLAVGSHTFTVTATDVAGNTATASVVFVVAPPGGLANADLHGDTLAKANLSNANLTGTNLSGATLTDATLTDATLTNANLSSANLTGATLTSANLTDANLNKANLTDATLTGANLSGANLNRAILSGATPTGVVWSNTVCPDGTNSNAHGGTCLGHLRTWL